jgi:hypothetical protein
MNVLSHHHQELFANTLCELYIKIWDNYKKENVGA